MLKEKYCYLKLLQLNNREVVKLTVVYQTLSLLVLIGIVVIVENTSV